MWYYLYIHFCVLVNTHMVLLGSYTLCNIICLKTAQLHPNCTIYYHSPVRGKRPP